MLDQSINKSLQGRWKDAEAGYRVALTYVEKVDIYGGLVGGSKKNESSNAPPPSPTEKLRSPDKHKQCLQCGKAGLVWGGVWGGGGRRWRGGAEVEGGSGRAGGWRGREGTNVRKWSSPMCTIETECRFEGAACRVSPETARIDSSCPQLDIRAQMFQRERTSQGEGKQTDSVLPQHYPHIIYTA